MDALSLLIGLVLGLVVGGVAAVLLLRSRRGGAGADAAGTAIDDPRLVAERHARELDAVRAEQAARQGELAAQLSGVQSALAGAREQLAGQQELYRDLMERSETDRRERIQRDQKDSAAESKVLQALSPVQESLRLMQAKVVELETQRSEQHGQLSEQLKSAVDSEERLRATAESLASALRNNATRGVWGETQLRNVVEAAGLTNRVDFQLQSSITSEHGAGRPDMVVHLPGGKSIAVDAKVPYNSYLEASSIPATATGEEEARRASLLDQHAKQVRAHVDALARKSYWTGLDASPEFTVAFIPSESLLAAALEHDATLLEYAFGKRIALASPVNLWAVLKTVAFTWQQDVLTDDAKRLFDLSKELYGRLATLSDYADKLGRSIASTVTSYNRFAASLESRVLVTARKLDALDEGKVIGEPKTLDERPSTLSAPELTETLAHELDALDATLDRVDEPDPDRAGLNAGADSHADDADAESEHAARASSDGESRQSA
ncbi:DNA recombination protein RmuC [Schumannella luteola]|uniref:DNA recombination protein RmuC n=1 Tax=Schumannella luteola TaxID=472059 RepID=A0A852YJW4_9MICO|nr:DNA recombination protein RmuC [Schumannella luteola]NYG99448.1 DNA recombination protein RmuC [Schumannella luteola]